jgi:opacity protein-like surface antigen
MAMKQTSKMVMVAAALLVGVSGNAWANGTEMPPPEPSTYTPPPPPPPMEKPAPAPAVKNRKGGPYISGAIGIGIPGSFKTDYTPFEEIVEHCVEGEPQEPGCNKCPTPPPPPPECTYEIVERVDTNNSSKFDLNTGLVLNGAIGYNFGSARLEGAVGYQKHDFKDFDDDISLLTLMANAYYDFDTGSDIRPYIMGGLGMAHVNMSWTSDDEDVFAWQLGAGLGFKVSENTTLDLGYRYLKPSDFDTHYLGDGELECHNIMLGLRYEF